MSWREIAKALSADEEAQGRAGCQLSKLPECQNDAGRGRDNRSFGNNGNWQQGEREARAGADAFDWRELFEERAAIREHDGGLTRTDAEAGAVADLAAHWRALNPLPAATDASADAACVHCGKPGPDTPVLAQGGHAWLHRECWAPMDRARDAQARAAVLAVLAVGGAQPGDADD